ncbi:hypothetical protein CEXT_745011 [Caerostris extrusa]|uniref:Uncharacterized protein n=1 Tax=Caerostris extrusa TaxID=172846 RepID=A0AAV4NTY4_CAEEX|nr:hypothetical protein CEXT_745011 [Caerostris extrusa]
MSPEASPGQGVAVLYSMKQLVIALTFPTIFQSNFVPQEFWCTAFPTAAFCINTQSTAKSILLSDKVIFQWGNCIYAPLIFLAGYLLTV